MDQCESQVSQGIPPVFTVQMMAAAQRFFGTYLYTGASTCVIGPQPAQPKFTSTSSKLLPARHNRRFKFGKGTQTGVAPGIVRIPTPGNIFIQMTVDVVEADIPFLLGLNVMTDNEMIMDLYRDTLSHPHGQWHILVSRHGGHLFLSSHVSVILFTRTELPKLHLRFFHPSSSKLYSLIRRARPT